MLTERRHGTVDVPGDKPSADVRADRSGRLPLALKILAGAFAVVLVAAYWPHYGPANFLWYSNVALLLVCLGIVIEAPLLISMAAVGVLLLELGWTADFLLRLATGRPAFGLTEYFWTGDRPAWVRALTLHHLALSPLLWWLTGRLGYDRRGFAAWCVLAGAVAGLVLLVSEPAHNINRLWGFGGGPQQVVPRALYLLIWAIVLPLGFWWPTHRLLLWTRPPATRFLSSDHSVQRI